MSMQSVNWVSFCAASNISRSLVHFFPSAGAVTAPYAASCKITIFSQGAEFSKESGTRSVNLEGARLSQPDGVRLEEVFPILKEHGAGLLGVEVELSTAQQRVDLSSSSVVVELFWGGQSVKFTPVLVASVAREGMDYAEGEVAQRGELNSRSGVESTKAMASRGENREPSQLNSNYRRARECIVIKDALTTTSLVFVNRGTQDIRPSVSIYKPNAGNLEGAGRSGLGRSERAGTQDSSLLSVPMLGCPARGVVEVQIPDALMNELPAKECSWGVIRSGLCVIDTGFNDPAGDELLAFVMLRDALTKRPVSVRAL